MILKIPYNFRKMFLNDERILELFRSDSFVDLMEKLENKEK